MISTVQIDGELIAVRCMESEESGALNRTVGAYSFYHFFGSVELYDKSECIITAPDCCCLLPPASHLRFICREPVRYDCIYLDRKAAELWMSCGLKSEQLYYPKPSTFISGLIHNIDIEQRSKKPYFEQMIELKLRELFIQISRACNEKPIILGKETVERFHAVRFKMFNSLNENWTVARMADEANLSPSYFHSIYKEIYGTSPTKDLITARIEEAKNLLQNSKDSISDISKSLGYNSPYHFTRQFRQAVGESPSKFRSKNNVY